MYKKIRSIFSSPSRLVILLIFSFILGVQNNQGSWRSHAVIEWDVTSYYSYLPATFIEGDLKMNFISDVNSGSYSLYAPHKAPNGNWVIKGSMGMAVMYAPFFLLAHFIAPYTGYPADGFSPIYQLAVLLAGLFYFIAGLFLLRKVLLHFYTEKITALTLAAIYFGTNLLCYTTLESPMSHQYIFFLFSAFIYFTVKWHHEQKLKYILALGLTFGMILLVRPINVLFILLFLLYGVDSIGSFKERVFLLLRNSLQMITFALLSFLVFLPQMLYWKYITGSYLFNSYIGESFYFAHPHLVDCLVGFRKGWLIYTPLMLFAVAGFFFLKKAAKPFFLVSILLVPLYFYLLASWWCWWYGGSFGLRAMIDLYPLLAFSLAAFFSSTLFKKKSRSVIVVTFTVLFIVLNLFQTIQFHYNIIHYDGMTMKAYFNSFGKTSKADCDRSLIKSPDYAKAMTGKE